MTETTDPSEAEYFSTIAARVRGLWAALDRTQADLCAVLDSHPETVRAKLAGNRRFTLNDIRLIARDVGVPISDFTEEID